MERIIVETPKLTIFDEQIERQPNNYPWTEEFIDAIKENPWTHKKFSFKSDIQQFKVNLSDEEREIIIRDLSAISQIETGVKKFWGNLGTNLPHPALLDLGYTMAENEVTHNRAYEALLNKLGLQDIFKSNLKLECLNGRVNYLRKYTHRFYKDSKKQFLYALILFTLFVENVSLFSQFYVVNWFARIKNVLKDVDNQVKYTRNEEQLHALIGIRIINTIKEELPELFDEELTTKVLDEAKEAFKAECRIIDWIIGDYKGNGINADILKEFIKYRLNESLVQIGFPEIFTIDEHLKDEFYWIIEEILANNMADFFHSHPTEYSENSRSFEIDDLF